LKCVFYLGTLNAWSQWCNRPKMNGGHGKMVLVKADDQQDLDMEWVALIMNARSLGFSKEDVRKVLLCLEESKSDDIQDTAV
jgi:hypothetical protein